MLHDQPNPLTHLAEISNHVADLLDEDGGPDPPTSWLPTEAELSGRVTIQPFVNGRVQESVALVAWVDDTRNSLSLLAENYRHTQHGDPATRRQRALIRRIAYQVIDRLEQLEAVAMRLDQSAEAERTRKSLAS